MVRTVTSADILFAYSDWRSSREILENFKDLVTKSHVPVITFDEKEKIHKRLRGVVDENKMED